MLRNGGNGAISKGGARFAMVHATPVALRRAVAGPSGANGGLRLRLFRPRGFRHASAISGNRPILCRVTAARGFRAAQPGLHSLKEVADRGGPIIDARKSIRMRAKIWKEFVHFFGVFVSMGIGYWVALQREPKDGWYFYVTALVVTLVVTVVYIALVYGLSLAWSRWRRSPNEGADGRA